MEYKFKNSEPILVNLQHRPRRNRRSESIRRMVRETLVTPNDLVLPVFVVEGHGVREPIGAMPEYCRLSRDLVVSSAKEAFALGIPAVALFPSIGDSLKTADGIESINPDGLLQRTIADLKNAVPEMCVISDVALDPYSSDGHDGILEDGRILNDRSLEVLAKMAVSQAEAGADIVAPSDMMDGRVGYIREALDQSSFCEVGILAYAAKYASVFYGPFREALNSSPKFGDKKSYQMDPSNSREALREVQLDVSEGADILMVKPALSYLDVIARVKSNVSLPIAAYSVSGEYAMIKAAAQRGFLDEQAAFAEMLVSIKRAGADLIFTYYAVQAAKCF